jgi:hypothetical protein
VRVRVFSSVHRLITGGSGQSFCRKHQNLLALAYMEYCARVIPAFMPVEYVLLKSEPGMEPFFATCPLACDTLRQELLNEDLNWAKLEEYSAGILDRHSRACKNRIRQHKEEKWSWGPDAVQDLRHVQAENQKIDPIDQQPLPRPPKPTRPDPASPTAAEDNFVDYFCRLPYLQPYAVHFEDPSNFIISSEMALLFGHQKTKRADLYSRVASMQRLLRVHPLPDNIAQMQLRALHARMRVCERSAIDAMVMYVCASCCLTGVAQRGIFQRGKCRLDLDTLVCSECQSPNVLRINTLGRIVCLRNHSYYLAPCCFSIQVYQGTALEFQTEFCDPDFFGADRLARLAWRPDVNPEMCTHRRAGRGAVRYQRPKCEVCIGNCKPGGGSPAPELFSAVDHLTGELKSIHLCHRHAPHSSVLRNVSCWEELMKEVQAQDKPLFSSRRK